MTSKIVCCVLSAFMVFSLTGCLGSKGPKPEAYQSQYYPECYDPIAKLCKDKDGTRMLKSAGKGALGGAVAGAAAGALIKGDWKGALVGAVVGAAAGAAIGATYQHLMDIKDQKQRLAQYQKELGESSQGWDLKRASVEKAYKCYREQIKHLTGLAKKKQIGKDEFLARMDDIKAGLDNIDKYWGDTQAEMDTTLADGDKFLEQQAKEEAAKRHAREIAAAKARKDKAQKQREAAVASVTKEKDLTHAMFSDAQTAKFFETVFNDRVLLSNVA